MGANSNIPDLPIITPIQNFDCDISVSYVAEDNLTYINKMEIPVINCPEIPLNTSQDFWNCNLCGSDEKYEQPVVDGDTIYIQVPISNNTYSQYRAYLCDNEGNLIEEDYTIVSSEILTASSGAKYFNIQVTASNIPVNCFYVKIYAFTGEIDLEAVDACIGDREGDGYQHNEAEILCLIQEADSYDEFYSELYRKTNDTCEDTLLISATYNDFDCQENYYGIGSEETETPHLLKFRIPGTLEKTEFNFEETTVFNTRRSSKQTDTYLLRTKKLPPYVAEQIALAFNSKNFYVDGVEYKRSGKISKNFDEGRMWIISVTVTRSCDEIDFLCS